MKSYNRHNPNNYEIIAKDCLASVNDQVSLEAWTIITPDGEKPTISVVMYHKDEIGFTTTDWQGWQPQTVDELQDCYWVDFDGGSAVWSEEGLPT